MEEFDEFDYRRLINIIYHKNYIGLDLEFIGILKDFELYDNKKSIIFLEYLIDCKIYLEQKEFPDHIYCPDTLEVLKSENLQFYDLDGFIYNEKVYKYNFNIYSEIYKITEYVIENMMNNSFKQDIIYLVSELKGIAERDDKIQFLNEKLKQYWKPFANSKSFLLFMNENHDWEGQTWEDEVRSVLVDDDCFLFYYLTCSKNENLEQSFYYKSIFKLWVENSRKQKLINFCNTEIAKLKYPNNNSKESFDSDLIFREDGLHVFNTLVSMSSKIKNTAFFSYLYLFLRKKDKIYSPKYQNKKYRQFVVQMGLIDSFSSIQKTDDNPKSEKNNSFEIFENDLKNYYSAKVRVKKE